MGFQNNSKKKKKQKKKDETITLEKTVNNKGYLTHTRYCYAKCYYIPQNIEIRHIELNQGEHQDW